MFHSHNQVLLFSRSGLPSTEADKALIPIGNMFRDLMGKLISGLPVYGTAEVAETLQELHAEPNI